jgi:O-antigen ligase
MKRERVAEILAILTILILPFSITGTYIPLTLSFFLAIRKRFDFPKDFLLIILLYLWRLFSLIFNGRELFEIKDIYEKLGYPVFSGLRVSPYKVLASFAFSVSALVILSFFFNGLYGDFGDFKGFYGHKHHAASLFSFSSIAFFTITLFRNPLFIFPFIFSLYALFLTKAYVYIYFTSLALLFLLLKRINFLRGFLYFSLATFPIILTLYFHSALSPKLIWSFSKRVEFWKIGLEVWKENPIFGIGYRHISDFLKPYFERGILDNYAHVHNSYLNALAETGIVGFLLVCVITIFFSLKYINLYRKTGSIFPLILSLAWIVYSLVGFFETNFDTAVLGLTLYFFMGVFEGEIKGKV